MNYSLLKPLLFKLNPETAHNLAIWALQHNLISAPKNIEYPSLQNKVFGIDFKNPIGMAAGFDKNAQVFHNLFNFGFGFVEVGTVTPKPQAGNEKPRIFRLEEDRAIINRLGFNNLGIENFLQNVEKNSQIKLMTKPRFFEEFLGKTSASTAEYNQIFEERSQVLTTKLPKKMVLGINIGKNKDTENAIDDYLLLLRKTYGKSDYITINISSPNTKNLRDLQKADELDLFLKAIFDEKKILQKNLSHQLPIDANFTADHSRPALQGSPKNIPILLKIAPDLNSQEQEAIADIALKNQIDGLIISNTTISRPQNLQSKFKNQIGGLSGKPLFAASNAVLKNISGLTNKKIPIIAVGGISSAADVYEKIKLGASLVQIYSAFIYQGFELVEQIKKELDEMLKKDGFKNISEAVGISS